MGGGEHDEVQAHVSPLPLQFPREGVESEEKGRILLTISYSAQDCALTIGVDRAVDLPAADSSGLADPYIKWYSYCSLSCDVRTTCRAMGCY